MASRTAGGIHHSVVAGPTRHWTKGDCTRFKKPVRPGLRQSSRAPELLPSSLHRSAHRACRSILLFLLRCNEVRLLSRRIIIRLHDDVKKKVQKNLPACIAPTSSHAQPHEDVATDIEKHRAHACDGTRLALLHARRDTPSRSPGAQLLHTDATPDYKARDARRTTTLALLRGTSHFPESRMDKGFAGNTPVRAWRCAAACRRMDASARDAPCGTRSARITQSAEHASAAAKLRHDDDRSRASRDSIAQVAGSDARTQRFASKQQREHCRSVAIEQSKHAREASRQHFRCVRAGRLPSSLPSLSTRAHPLTQHSSRRVSER